jgi:hypothetical protein
MTNTYQHIFDKPIESIDIGTDNKIFYVDLIQLKGTSELIIEALNAIPEDAFYLARFIADNEVMDTIQDKLPEWYEKLKTHAENQQNN